MTQILFLPILFFMTDLTVDNILPANVHHWNELEVQKTKSGERRQVLDGETEVFEHFEIHVTTLRSGLAPHGSHVHQDHEELIIVKEGKVKQQIGDEIRILGPGSIIFATPGDEHGLHNAGEENASYYVIKWKARNAEEQADGKDHASWMIDWQELDFKETEKGGRRHIVRQPTSMLHELEMHATTLDEGKISHGQHTHKDEEIIVVLKGKVEELIDGTPHEVEAGSVIYLSSMIPHGIRNIGKGACTYIAMRWIPKTP